jgi:hypothetical protein
MYRKSIKKLSRGPEDKGNLLAYAKLLHNERPFEPPFEPFCFSALQVTACSKR